MNDSDRLCIIYSTIDGVCGIFKEKQKKELDCFHSYYIDGAADAFELAKKIILMSRPGLETPVTESQGAVKEIMDYLITEEKNRKY